MIKCCIFDLDGVIVDTAKYHYLAWKHLAASLGFDFTAECGEATRGVSRMASLEIVLAAGGMQGRFSDVEKQHMAERKNACYLEYVSGMTSDDILGGVKAFLHELRAVGIAVVLGSSSCNARLILKRCDIENLFDAVVDGEMVLHAKPDPEVFLLGAKAVGVEPSQCIVFEDAQAGIEAALCGGMRSVGVGCSPKLADADIRIASFEGFTLDNLIARLDNFKTKHK